MLMFSSNKLWNIPRVTSVFPSVFSRYTPEPSAGCVYLENTSDSWDIPWYTMRKGCITILYHSGQQATMETWV